MTCSLLITCLPDGTFHVKETEPAGGDPSDQPVDQSFQSPDEVLQVVQQFLSEGSGSGADSDSGPDSEMPSDSGPDSEMPDDSGAPAAPASGKSDPAQAAAWNQEAATRSPSGYRSK